MQFYYLVMKWTCIIILCCIFTKTISQQSCSSYTDCNYIGCGADINYYTCFGGLGREPTYGCNYVDYAVKFANGLQVVTYSNSYGNSISQYNRQCWRRYWSDCYTETNPALCTVKPCDTTCSSGSYVQTCYCTSCTAGSFCTGTLSISGICSPGTYSLTGQSTCTNCNAGTYSSIAGATTCVSCAAGTYNENIKSVSVSNCTECVLGKYNPNIGSSSNTSCMTCAPGFTTYSIGSSICLPECDIGKYAPLPNGNCIDCPSGKFNLQKGSTFCVNCAAGFYCPNSTTTVLCSMGFYSTGNSSFCSNCTIGTYNTITGMSFCLNCAAGNYCPNVTFTAPCMIGKYSLQNMTTCTICSIPGYTTTAMGMSTCLLCSPGSFCKDGLSNLCFNGTYVSAPGQSVCTSCAPGTFSTGSGITSPSTCTLCSAGKFQSGAGSSACTTCSSNSYTPDSLGGNTTQGSTACFVCVLD